MAQRFLKADGRAGSVGDKGNINEVIARLVREATIPATYNEDGSILTPEIVPDAATVAIEITEEELKTHSWHLPHARSMRLQTIRGLRDFKLNDLDMEYQRADEGSHPTAKTKAQVAAEKQTLRDLPPVAEAHLATLNNTDDIDSYLPDELA